MLKSIIGKVLNIIGRGLNNIGPRMFLCGSPDSTGDKSECKLLMLTQ